MRDSSKRLPLTALRIYRYMVLKGTWVGVREIQRSLKLSSPGLVAYHLSKLVSEGLIERGEGGKYRVKNYVEVEFLKDFVRLGRVVIPRYVFYATFTAVLTISYVALYPRVAFSEGGLIGLILGLFATLSYIYETVKVMREI